MVQQIHVLETMRPIDFLAFRNQLTPAIVSSRRSARGRCVTC
jgi:hypothetical protein